MKWNYKQSMVAGVGLAFFATTPFIGLAQDGTTGAPPGDDAPGVPPIVAPRRGDMPLNPKPGLMRDLRKDIREERRDAGQDRRVNTKEERVGAREDIRDAREVMRKDIHTLRASTTIDIEEKRKDFHESIKAIPPVERREKMEEFRKEIRVERQEIRKEIKDQREEFRIKTKDRLEEMKNKIGEDRAKRVEESFGHMIARMEEATDKLNDLGDRIGSRLDTLAVAGKDVTAQQAALTLARQKIADAETAIAAAKTAYDAMIASATPKDAFPQVQSAVKKAQGAIKDAHAALVKVVESIKKGRLDSVSTGTNASSTTSQ